jgi:hypothetical protein
MLTLNCFTQKSDDFLMILGEEKAGVRLYGNDDESRKREKERFFADTDYFTQPIQYSKTGQKINDFYPAKNVIFYLAINSTDKSMEKGAENPALCI